MSEDAAEGLRWRSMGEGKRIRGLVVDDSPDSRTLLKAILEAEGDMEIVAEGEDAFSALALVEEHRPDVVTMEVQMPGKNGLEAVEQIMFRAPVPILVVTAEPLTDEAGVAFKAIENGAVEVVPKPGNADAAAAKYLRELVRSVAATPAFQRVDTRAETAPAPASGNIELVVFVGGPGAMSSVLSVAARLPEQSKCPVVLYEPVAPELLTGYTRYIAKLAKQPVQIAAPPECRCRPGALVVIPGLRASCMMKGTFRIESTRPSPSTLLTSIAEVYGSSAAAVVLAGAGEDSIEGLVALRDAGGATIAEISRDGASPFRAIVGAEASASSLVDRLFAVGFG